ncbi:serine/threonine-protein kinase [Tundrisphaera sp. TA3]|uniref:serine/threonine-protein kinase n=1 Tax=Tundrisphaera sp. TA3 TaxID=3435775 RepID=UPI003EBB362B
MLQSNDPGLKQDGPPSGPGGASADPGGAGDPLDPLATIRDRPSSADRAGSLFTEVDPGGCPPTTPPLDETCQASIPTWAMDRTRSHNPGPPPTFHDLPAGESRVGTRLGDYEIVRYITKGGMGYVYEAVHLKLRLPVALKTIRPELTTKADVDRFLAEAQAVAKLHSHPNIVKIHGINFDLDEPYFVMQYVRGGSLRGRPEFQADPRRAVEVMIKAAEAITHAHRKGILHRDLKPDNILIDEDSTPFVTDFGLAKRVDPTEGGTVALAPTLAGSAPGGGSRIAGFDTGQEQEGSRLGTPSYMPPEQALGRQKDVTTLSDVYGLGATFFALLCGRPPFVGSGVADILTQVVEAEVPSPRALNPLVDPDLDAICRKCMAKDPKDRYPSADSLAHDLRRWLEGKPVHARPIGMARRAARWVRREPAKVAGIGLIAALGGLAGYLRYEHYLDGLATDLNERKVVSAFRSAGDAVAKLTDTFERELGSDTHQDPIRVKVLDAARKYFVGVIQEHKGQLEQSPRGRIELAKAYINVAELGNKTSDSGAASDPNFDSAISVLAPLDGEAGVDPATQREAMWELGHAYHEYGILLTNRGNDHKAVEQFERGRKTRAAICEPCPAHEGRRDGCVGDFRARNALGQSHGWIGDYYSSIGDSRTALAEYSASHRIRRTLHDDLAKNLAGAKAARAEAAAAGGAPTLDDAAWKALVEEEVDAALQLSRSFGNLAMQARYDGKLGEAIASREEGNRLLRGELADPEGLGEISDKLRRDLAEDMARGHHQLAELIYEDELYKKAGDLSAAFASAGAAIKGFEDLVRARGGVEEYRFLQATSEVLNATLLFHAGRDAEASAACDRAEALFGITPHSQEDSERRLALARHLLLRGRLDLRGGRPQAALDRVRASIQELDKLIERSRHVNEYLSQRAESLFTLAMAYRALGRPDDAWQNLIAAIDEQDRVYSKSNMTNLYFDRLTSYKEARREMERPRRPQPPAATD